MGLVVELGVIPRDGVLVAAAVVELNTRCPRLLAVFDSAALGALVLYVLPHLAAVLEAHERVKVVVGAAVRALAGAGVKQRISKGGVKGADEAHPHSRLTMDGIHNEGDVLRFVRCGGGLCSDGHLSWGVCLTGGQPAIQFC